MMRFKRSIGKKLENLVESPFRPHRLTGSLAKDTKAAAKRTLVLAIACWLQGKKLESKHELSLAKDLLAEAWRLRGR